VNALPGVTHWDGPPLDAWNAWDPWQAQDRLRRSDVPWCVVGGWSVDLAAGRQTRPHEDLEIAVLRSDFSAVRRALPELGFFVVGDGEVRALADGAEPPADKHQNWVLDRDADEWRVDVMLESGTAEEWVYRKDPRLTAPRAEMVAASADGIPYLRPHGALLFKAKDPRPKDEADFTVADPLLSESERAWLVAALATTHPDHPWLERLSGPRAPRS